MPLKVPLPSLRSLVVIVPLLGACSLLFGQADDAVNSDAGRADDHDGATERPDAGPTVAWEPSVEWSSVVEPFHTAGVGEEAADLLTLVGELRGKFSIDGGKGATPSGLSDLAFLSVASSDGAPLSIDAFGDDGTINILNSPSYNGTQGIVGIFTGNEMFCPTSNDPGCNTAPPGATTGAFASLYNQPPNASVDPESVVTLTYSDNTTAMVPETLIMDAIPSTDRQLIVGYYKRGIVLSSTQGAQQIENADETTKNLFILNLGENGALNKAIVPDEPGDQLAWAIEPSGETNIFAVGTYEGELDLGLEQGQSALPPSDGNALFVLHANRALTTAHWTKAIGMGVSGRRVFAKASPDGGVVIAGSFVDSLALPNTTVLENIGGSETVFVLKLSSDGNIEWSHTYGSGSGATRVHGLVIGADGEFFVSGEFEGEMELGESSIESNGDVGTFLVRLDTLGRTRGGLALGSASIDPGTNLFALEDESVLVEVFDSTMVGGANDAFVGRTLYRIR